MCWTSLLFCYKTGYKKTALSDGIMDALMKCSVFQLERVMGIEPT